MQREEKANQSVQVTTHEGHTAYALDQRYRSKTPVEGVLKSGHLLFKLLDVELLDDIILDILYCSCYNTPTTSPYSSDWP